MLGAVRPSTVRANTSPMTANSTRLRASHCTLAPRSSITTSPRAEGPIAGHRRAVDPRQRLDDDLGQRQQRPGVAGRDDARRPPRRPPRRSPRAWRHRRHAQRRGRLHVVADDVGRVADVQARAAPRAAPPAAARAAPRRRPAGSARRGWRSAAISSPSTTMSGAWSPPIASIARANVASVKGRSTDGRRTRSASGADGALQRLAGGDHLAPVVMAAMAADMVRALQLAAVRALGVRLGAAAPDGLRRMPRRDGEVFLLGTAMGLRPSGLRDALRPEGAGRSQSGNNVSRGV